MAEDITFFSKNELVCPVCETHFKREDLLSGRGRLNAGNISNELRRSYIPTQKYGEINPLLYPITVCPNCLYASEKTDFPLVNRKNIEILQNLAETRAKYMIKIFGQIPDFYNKRELESGAASYILAISCYPFFEKKKYAPAAKIGINSLRAAWLMNDLYEKTNKIETKYKELSEMFYRKAAEYYNLALERQTKAEENMDAKWLGPDTDNDFGYDGFLYINAVLNYKNSIYEEDPLEKLTIYENNKRILSKVFGIGRKAKDKPELILNMARDVYDKISEEQDKLKATLGELDEVPEEEHQE